MYMLFVYRKSNIYKEIALAGNQLSLPHLVNMLDVSVLITYQMSQTFKPKWDMYAKRNVFNKTSPFILRVKYKLLTACFDNIYL